MSSTAAIHTSLFGTTWIANSALHDVNKLSINFNQPTNCVVTFLGGNPKPQIVNCTWTESYSSSGHFFGLTGGSVSLHGSCSVATGTGQAQGFAAGSPSQAWTLQKQ